MPPRAAMDGGIACGAPVDVYMEPVATTAAHSPAIARSLDSFFPAEHSPPLGTPVYLVRAPNGEEHEPPVRVACCPVCVERASERFQAALLAGIVAEAARKAVAEAFAELRPALLKVVAVNAGSPQRLHSSGSSTPRMSENAEKAVDTTARRGLTSPSQQSCSDFIVDGPAAADAAARGADQDQLASGTDVQLDERPFWKRPQRRRMLSKSRLAKRSETDDEDSGEEKWVGRRSTEPSITPWAVPPRSMSLDGGLSIRPCVPPSPTTPHTVASLQTNLAQALLDNSGWGAVRMAGGPRGSRAVAPVRRGELSFAVSPSRQRLRIMPEPAFTGLASPPASTASSLQGASDSQFTLDIGQSVMDSQHDARSSGEVPSFYSHISTDADTHYGEDSDGMQKSNSHLGYSKRRMTSEQVLQARIQELAQEAAAQPIDQQQSEACEESSKSSAVMTPYSTPYPLVLFGVLGYNTASHPWGSMAYQWFARLVIAMFVFVFFLPSLRSVVPESWHDETFLPDCDDVGKMCWTQEGFVSQVPLPLGAFLVLAAFTFKRQQRLLEETLALLHGVSVERGFRDWCTRQARADKAVFLCIWWSIVLTSWMCAYFTGKHSAERDNRRVVLYVSMISLFSAVILGLAYSMVVICRYLTVMIDTFCCDIVGKRQLQDVSYVWNLTQAVLRKASVSIEMCLLTLCIIVAITVPLLLFDVGVLGSRQAPIPTVLPGLFVTCGVLYVLLLAAMITEKCSRVPSLINAVDFGPGTERARQHTVDYVTGSAAGFYVFGMRLTTAMAVKLMYVWCIVAVSLLAKLPGLRR